MLADLDLADLLAAHRANEALATLCLVDWPAVNSVAVAADGAVLAIGDRPAPAAAGRRLTYAGVGAFAASLLDDIEPGFSSLVDPLVRALAARPGAVRAWIPAVPGWTDLGTLPRWLEAAGDAGPLDGGAGRLEPITGHGSDRRFWRIAAPGWSAVAMRGVPGDEEFARGVAIARFLADADLGAAAVLAEHPAERVVLTEDLGRTPLIAVAAGPQRDAAYAQVVDHLVRLQAATGAACTRCPAATDRTLDLDVLVWETTYFRTRCLAGHFGLGEAELAPLDAEFAVAERGGGGPAPGAAAPGFPGAEHPAAGRARAPGGRAGHAPGTAGLRCGVAALGSLRGPARRPARRAAGPLRPGRGSAQWDWMRRPPPGACWPPACSG